MAESVSTAVASLLSILLIGRAIGAEALGAATIALSAFLLIDVLGASLFTDALVQHRAPTARHRGSAASVHLLVGCVAGLLLAGLAPLIASGAGLPEVQALTLALAPLLPLSAWCGFASAGLMREQRFALLAMRALLGQPLALLAGLTLARMEVGAWAMIASQATTTLITASLLRLRGGPTPQLTLDRAALSELWRVAGPLIASIVVLVGRYRVFMLALGLVTVPSVVALSHVAFRLIDGALVVVYQSSFRIGLPRLAPAHASGDRGDCRAIGGQAAAATCGSGSLAA
jgi:O-antigen/teichoic acid export membrane protein